MADIDAFLTGARMVAIGCNFDWDWYSCIFVLGPVKLGAERLGRFDYIYIPFSSPC